MPALEITLTAIDKPLADAWQRWCGDLVFVHVHQSSIFDVTCDAIVSPANSFGFMDGGIDRLYTERYGLGVQERLQSVIQAEHAGELLVGKAAIVETEDEDIPYLIAAPTMRVPMVLEHSLNPYLAARAVFLLIRDGKFSTGTHCKTPIADHVKSIVFPGLGTGVGRVPAVQCAKQMRAAIEDVVLRKAEFPQTTAQARKRHDRLTRNR